MRKAEQAAKEVREARMARRGSRRSKLRKLPPGDAEPDKIQPGEAAAHVAKAPMETRKPPSKLRSGTEG